MNPEAKPFISNESDNKQSFFFEILSGNADTKVYLALIAVIILGFSLLTVGSALTTRPESDEGGFANPAYNLVTEGHFGTTVMEMEHSSLTRIDQRTYWVLPLFLLNAAASFKILGFSLLSMRLVSAFWGIILILSWYFIILKLLKNRMTAVLAMSLVAFNYVVLTGSSLGRGDVMCAALGFAAIAVYIWLRERNLLLAVLLSQTLVTASGLTHFNGFLAFLGLLFITLYYDFRALRWQHLFVVSIPYLVGGTTFGIWVLQDPEAFKDQFITNALMSGRMDGFSSPLSGIIREFTFRYPRAFGLLEHSAGHSGPIYLKSLMLIAYLAGVLGVIFTRSLRQNKNVRALIILTAIYFITLALLDGQKLAVYLIYLVPLYCILLAVWLYRIWEINNRLFPMIALVIGGIFSLQAGGLLLKIKQNTYGNYYLPTVQFLNKNTTANDTILGGSELRFALQTQARHYADGNFGFYTGKRPEYIVYDPGVEDSWKDSKTFFPEFYEYFPKLLKEEYKIVYENTAYKVYARKDVVLNL